MLEHFNRHRPRRKPGEYRSKLEEQVAADLGNQGLAYQYESEKFRYVPFHRNYTPDFKVGNVYIEVKGWWPPAERTKFLAVLVSNPGLRIFVALQRPFAMLNKKSKTTLAEWCQKHGIPWSPIPIPHEFLEQWLDGQRPTFHVPHRTAKAVTGQASTTKESSIALSVIETSTLMDHLGVQ
jgi:hypothetical protein